MRFVAIVCHLSCTCSATAHLDSPRLTWEAADIGGLRLFSSVGLMPSVTNKVLACSCRPATILRVIVVVFLVITVNNTSRFELRNARSTLLLSVANARCCSCNGMDHF
jgi:hypothetical protein